MAKPITIYGIKNCDTMKKARAWLDGHRVAYAFHDYKVAGIEKRMLEAWAAALGWEVLLNRSGTTFRKLPDADKEGLTEKRAIALMLAQPSMIKRPVLDIGGKLIAGFKPEVYEKAFFPSLRSGEGDRALARWRGRGSGDELFFATTFPLRLPREAARHPPPPLRRGGKKPTASCRTPCRWSARSAPRRTRRIRSPAD